MSERDAATDLEAWHRMKRVVDAYSAHGRKQEADYCMIDFFLCFDDPVELEAHVRAAEEAAQEVGVL